MRGIRAIEALVAMLAIAGCSRVLNITPDEGDGGGTLPDGGTPRPDGETPLPEAGESGAPDGSASSLILADGLENADALAVDEKSVWFTRSSPSGAILSVPKAGGKVALIRDGDVVSMPTAIAVSTQGVYWAAQNGAGPFLPGVRWLSNGGLLTRSLDGTPGGLSLLGLEQVLWTRPTTGEIFSADSMLGGATAFPGLFNSPTGILVAAEASYVYWATVELAGRVYRALPNHTMQEIAGENTVTTAPRGLSFDSVSALAAGSSLTAWADSQGVYTTARDSTSFKNGPTKVSPVTNVVSIAIDDLAQVMYFLTGGTPGQIFRKLDVLSPASSSPTPIAGGPTCKQGKAITMDADALYVACSDAILRIPKPPK